MGCVSKSLVVVPALGAVELDALSLCSLPPVSVVAPCSSPPRWPQFARNGSESAHSVVAELLLQLMLSWGGWIWGLGLGAFDVIPSATTSGLRKSARMECEIVGRKGGEPVVDQETKKNISVEKKR